MKKKKEVKVKKERKKSDYKVKPFAPKRPHRRELERYRAFANAYLAVGEKTYLNAMASALISGYSKASCKGNSYKLLARPEIQAMMIKIKNERIAQSTIATPQEVLEALTSQLRVLPNKLVDPETKKLIPLDEITDETAKAIAGYEVTDRIIPGGDQEDPTIERKTKYKMVDRVKVAEILAKHHGLFEKDNEQQKPDEPVRFVMMPSGDMTLAEWTRQVDELNAARAAETLRKAG